MKILDTIADKILNIPTMEMAVRRKIAIQKISTIQKNLMVDLVRFLYVTDYGSQYWFINIMNSITELQNIQINDIQLPSSVYFYYLFEDYYGNDKEIIPILRSDLKRKMSPYRVTNLSAEQLTLIIKEFYTWLCPQIESCQLKQDDTNKLVLKQIERCVMLYSNLDVSKEMINKCDEVENNNGCGK